MLKKGVQLTAAHQFNDAANLFEEVLAKDPNNVDAYYDLGAVAEDRGDFSAALNFYNAAQGLAPSDRGIAQAIAAVQNTINATTPGATNSNEQNATQAAIQANDPNLDGFKKLMHNEHRRQTRQKAAVGIFMTIVIGIAIAAAVH